MDTFRLRGFALADCAVFLAFADLACERPLVLRDAARGFFFGYRLRLGFATFVTPLTALRTDRWPAAGFPARAPTTPPTTAPIGPATLPIAAPATAPAVSLEIGEIWMSSDGRGFLFFCRFERWDIRPRYLWCDVVCSHTREDVAVTNSKSASRVNDFVSHSFKNIRGDLGNSLVRILTYMPIGRSPDCATVDKKGWFRGERPFFDRVIRRTKTRYHATTRSVRAVALARSETVLPCLRRDDHRARNPGD